MPRYKVKLTTLSPVHIGNGETYEPSQLYINDDKVFILHPNHFSDCLENENLNSELRNWFLSEKQQLFLSDFKGFNFTKVQACSTYNSPLHCKIDSKDKKVWKVIRNPLKDFKPFIPGSSLKGALLTPIFSDFFFHQEREEKTLEKLESYLTIDNSFKLESQLKQFHQSTNKNERFNLKKNWKRQAKNYLEYLKSLYKQFEEVSYVFSPNLPKQSKLKFDFRTVLSVSDSFSGNCESEISEVLILTKGSNPKEKDDQILVLNIKNTKLERKEENQNAALKDLKNFIEFVPQNSKFEIQDFTFWTEEKIKSIFGLNSFHNSRNEKIKLEHPHFKYFSNIFTDFQSIRKIINDFYKDVLITEKVFVENYLKIFCKNQEPHFGFRKIAKSVKNNLENLETAFKDLKSNEIVLKVGKYSGFKSLTFANKFEESDVELFVSGLSRILDYRGHSEFPVSKRVIKTNYGYEFPGWVKLTFTEEVK